MADFEEELRMDEEENAREVVFIREQLPSELKDKFGEADILYIMDAIVDYYVESGVLDAGSDDDDYVDIDLQKAAEYVCRKAADESHGNYVPDEVFFIVQADMDFQDLNT